MTLLHKLIIPTEPPPLVGEVSANFAEEGVAWSAQQIPTAVNFDFLDPELLFYIEVAPQLSSWIWVDPDPHFITPQKIW
jgi:hypothetical protein